jgi:hypothetical protein
MKTTINTWRNTVLSSQYFQMLETTPDKIKNTYRGYKHEDRSCSTSFANILWYHLGKEVKSKIGQSDFKVYSFIDLEGNKIDRWSYEGMYIYIHTSFSICRAPIIEYTFNNVREQFKVSSNKPLTEKLIIDLVLGHVNKVHLFKPGVFRDLQIGTNRTKKQTLEFYKNRISKSWREETDRDAAVYDYIEKKFNIICDRWLFKDEDKAYKYCLNYFKSNGKPEKSIYIERFRPYELLEDFDGDIDEAEDLLQEHFDNNPNTIFI